MDTSQPHLAQIAKEVAAAREAIESGNEGKARVCARRAAGQAITWFLSRHPRPEWPADALMQLRQLSQDGAFPQDVRDAAVRLTTKISERFTYPFSTNPLADANIIIQAIERIMDSAHD